VANYKNSQKHVNISGFREGKGMDFSREDREGGQGWEAFGETRARVFPANLWPPVSLTPFSKSCPWRFWAGRA
jgi:hypothetical protein